MITLQQLKEQLIYDNATGVFTNKKGKQAGSVDSNGYRVIRVFGKLYRASHLAALHETGEWPVGRVTHRNGDRSDDRFFNLFEIIKKEPVDRTGMAYRNNKTGVRGVTLQAGKYLAKIRINGKLQYLGSFDTLELAAQAFQEASDKKVVTP